jgi:excisionase family DNA binding protein
MARSTGSGEGEREGEREGELSLPEASARLGVHYMTAYRYVRTGRLPATRVNGEWRIRADDVDGLLRGPAQRPSRRRDVAGVRRRLLDRLVAGDEVGAWTLVDAAIAAGLEPTDAHLQLLAPTLATVGERWAEGSLTIHEEHLATAVASRLIGRLGPRFAPSGRTRGTVVIAGAPDDHHALPVAMAADILRASHHTVLDLGAATPPDELARAVAGADRLLAVAICVSRSDNEANVAAAVAATRHAAGNGVPILVGGGAADPALASAAGADAYGASALDLVTLVGPSTDPV